MKDLWNRIDLQNWRAETKYHAVILILGAAFALAGFILWIIVRKWAFSTYDWMVCFIGYPIVLSWIAVVFYSSRHNMHNGVYSG